jgi:hypothetical protein
VEGNLSADIRCLNQVKVVIKRGHVVQMPQDA